MQVVQFIYEDQPVDFEAVSDNNVMVNATQMAKIFGKRLDHFLRSDHAKAFINELELTPFGGSSVALKPDEIIKTKNGVNTFFHRILALKFAAWLDTKFELWVYTTIDQMINHFFREQREAMIEKLRIEQEREKLKRSLLIKYPDLQQYFELEKRQKKAAYKKTSAIKKQMDQLRLQFVNN